MPADLFDSLPQDEQPAALDPAPGPILEADGGGRHAPPYHIGSCAWMFDDWRAAFYPADLPQNRWLGWYARFFNAVEIDSTFYATPPATNVARWLGEAPPHFRFTCKVPKTITHERRLRGCEKLLEEFLEAMQPLHGRMGPVLIQLPPRFEPELDATALREFIFALPRQGWRFAIEFRHSAWHQPRFAHLLEDYRIGWVWSDMSPLTEQNQAPFGFLPETADFLYLRLMGDQKTKFNPAGERVHHYNRGQWSRAAALESWAVRLRNRPEHIRGVYIFANNHYEGFAPATCRALAAQLGIDVRLPEIPAPKLNAGAARQMKLL